MTILDTSVLVLNRLYVPIHVASARRSFSLVFAGGARVVNANYETFTFEEWCARGVGDGDDAVGTVSGSIAVPRVILLTHFDRMPRRQVRFSRNNIFSRDAYTCQYCDRRPSRAEMNLDHVIPRAQGGRTTWENVVASCVSCNRRKGGRTPEQAGFRLRRKPVRPRWSPFLGAQFLTPGAGVVHASGANGVNGANGGSRAAGSTDTERENGQRLPRLRYREWQPFLGNGMVPGLIDDAVEAG